MKVLFQTYSLAHQNPGGGERVIAHLHRELKRRGVPVTLREPWQNHPEDFDILHYFSMAESAHFGFFKTRNPALKIVVTPTLHVQGFESSLARIRELVGSQFGINENKRLKDSQFVDHFFPSTSREALVLQKYFSVPEKKISVLENGISPVFGKVSPELFRKFSKIEGDFVLHVGRFDPVKNQRFLIEALADQPLTCVFIGNPDPFSSQYYDKCLEMAGKSGKAKFFFYRDIQPDSELLASAMAAAKIFALPSDFETFGIAALEAQSSGCGLVLSSGVVARELFPDAEFLPLQKKRWSEIIQSKLHSSSDKREIKTKDHSWESIAGKLLAQYELMLRS